MNLLAVAASPLSQTYGLGQSIFFWICATCMVALGIGILVLRKAVHSAICMIGVMICLAMMYVSLGAKFLGVVQIVVYTGAVMTLILFIIMMIGVSASDNYRRTRAGLRWGAGVLGLVGMIIYGFVAYLAYLPTTGTIPAVKTEAGGTDSNPVLVALSIFTDHMFTMEVVGGLLIIAAIGAMSLTHSDLLRKVFRQPETSAARLLEYQARGTHPGQRPAPGVYAETNAVDAPAISGETESAVKSSVMPALRARQAERTLGEGAPSVVAKIRADKEGDPSKGIHSLEATRAVKQSGAWGMGNVKAESSLEEPLTKVMKPSLEDLAEQEEQS